MGGAKWFKFFPDDWLASSVVMSMTPLEEVTYLRLLLFDWAGNGIENNPERLAMLTRTDAETVETVVKRAFNEHPNDRSKLTNKRLHELREDMAKQQKQREEAARKSVESRRKSRTTKRVKAELNERSTKTQTPVKRSLNEIENKEVRKEEPKKEIKKKKVPFPYDFEPNKLVATENGLDFAEAFQFFKNWAEANGKTYLDWDKTWANACRTWLADRLLGDNRNRQKVGTTEERHGQGW